MKILLILCGFAVLAAARPNRSHFRKELLRRLRDEKHKIARTSEIIKETCGTSLSNAAGGVLSNLAGMPGVPVKEKLRDFSVRVVGFDIFDDEEARRETFCKLSGLKDVAGLKTAMEDYDYQLFRLLYAYISIMIPMAPHTAAPFQQQIHTIEALGLAQLDPEGVEWCLDATEMRQYYEMVTAGNAPYPPSGDTLEQKCLTLQQLVAQMIDYMFVNGNPMIATMIEAQIRDWTGINIFDEEQINTLLCDLMTAAQNGLEAVYDVIDGYGIVDQLYQTGYPLAVSQLRMGKQQLIDLAKRFESMLNTLQNEIEMNPSYDSYYPEAGTYTKISHNGPSYNYGGPPHGGPNYGGPPHGEPNYGGPPHGEPNYGGPPHGGSPYGGPNYGGPDYGGPPQGGSMPDVPSLSTTVDLIHAVVIFIEAMEETGLLSLQ